MYVDTSDGAEWRDELTSVLQMQNLFFTKRKARVNLALSKGSRVGKKQFSPLVRQARAVLTSLYLHLFSLRSNKVDRFSQFFCFRTGKNSTSKHTYRGCAEITRSQHLTGQRYEIQ